MSYGLAHGATHGKAVCVACGGTMTAALVAALATARVAALVTAALVTALAMTQVAAHVAALAAARVAAWVVARVTARVVIPHDAHARHAYRPEHWRATVRAPSVRSVGTLACGRARSVCAWTIKMLLRQLMLLVSDRTKAQDDNRQFFPRSSTVHSPFSHRSVTVHPVQ